MANDFSSRFLKLREERLERQSSGQAASGSGTTRTASPSPAPAQKVTATAQKSGTEDSFSSRFLKLREERLNRQAEGQARPSAASASPATPIRSAASMLSRMERPASFGLSEQRAATQTPAAGQTGGQGGRTTRRAQLESDLAKVNQEQRLLAARTNLARRSRGFTTEDREAAEAEAAPLRREAEDLRHGVEGIDYQDKYDAITRKDNFGGQFLSSYDVGRMGQDEAMAWYEYLSNPTEGNRAYAESVSAALQDYILRNQAALDEDAALPIVSQSLARYLPQFIDQNVAGVKGALAGAAAGSVLPVAGTAAGAKAGYAGGRALYGYETARGAAFKALLDAGVDEETARAASNDEAIINSVIEGGDAVLDMLTLGIGRGISAILGQPVEAAATTAGRKALAALGKYGINVASEGAQEWVQEGVSAANEGRTDTGLLNLIGESAGQIGRAVSGQDPEALARMNEAGLEGLRVAAIMGAAGMAGNAAVNRVLGRPAAQQQSQEDGLSQEAEAQAQPDSGIPEATRRAVEMLAQGEAISGNQAARIAESEEAMALLSQLTGEEIDTDAPISRVKSDIRALASRQERLSGEAVVNSQATVSGAQTQVQTQERPAAMRAYDVRRMEQAADALGESGSRALKAAYDGSADADRFYAGFSTYYEAGLSGRDMGRVRSEYAQDLTEAQRYAAYTAGQNDGLASLQREREGVQFATVYGDEAGFIPSDYSGNLPQDTVRFYNALGRATGTKITIAAATGEGGANGWYSNGTVYIAADAESAGSVVAKHEITHRLQEIAPEAYRTYRDYAVNAMAERDGSTAALVERYKARYAQSGVNLTTEQAMDEIAADFTESLTVDPSRFDTLAQEHRSVARRVLDALRDFISKVKALFKGRSDQDQAAMSEYGVSMETLERAAQLWEEALRAGQAQVRGSVVGTEGGYARVDGKFSLKGVVEDNGTLLALHNLTEDKLRSALRLGGFPMPSIAVTRADIPHTNFGDITLVMSRQTVDPRANRRNTVYSADAWTPTFPAIEYEADPQAERRISRRIGELSAQVDPFFQDDLRRVQYGLDDYLNRHGGEEGLARWAMDNYGLKAAYLEEQGRHIAAVTTQREADRGYSADRAEQYQAVADVLGTTDPEAIGSMNLKELRDQHGEALERAYPGMTKSALRMSGVLRQVQAYLEGRDSEPTYEAVTDSAATRRAVDNALDQAGYEQWVRELYSGIEAASGVYNNKERFTPSGNRRSFQQTHYPVTLDNITKAMAGQNNGDSRNVSGFYGIKSLRAGMAERFKSIADMHRLEGRLQNLTQEEADAISNALDSRLSSIMEELAEKSPGGGRRYDYMQMDAIGNILMEIADGGTYTIDSIMRRLNEEYHYHVGNELAAKIRDLLFDVSQMPVNLFEAKPERSVHFNEVLAAVLPDNVWSGLSDDLLAAGVGQVLTYEEGNDADRLAKVNSVEGARFSLKPTDSRGRELSEEQQEFFRDSVIRDEQGRLMVMYHGTRNGGFTVFDGGKDYFYFTNNMRYSYTFEGRKANGQLYPSTRADMEAGLISPQRYEVYLNVTNPFIAEQDVVEDALYWDRSLAQQLRDRGYDALMMEDMSQVIVLSPEQIKNVTNKTPTQDPDIRRSIKGGDILRQNAALQEENELLRERVEYWRGQTRRTERVSIDKKAVTRAAREMIRAYDSGLDAAELAGDLQGLYSFVMNDGDERGAFSDTELRRRANEIARKLVDSAAVLEDESYRDYADLRVYLRDTPLSISAEDRGDIADFGDFRRRNFGRMTIRSGPTNIDQVYQELAAAWPEFFDEMRESTPSDQLVHIAEVLDGIYQVTERNPFAGYFDAAVTDAANEIMERFFDLPQTRPTFADRQARKLDSAKAAGRRRLEEQRERSDARLAELRQQNRERVQRAIQRERETRARQIDRLKTRYAARDAAGRERRSARELRARISRHVADLNRRLLRPSDKRHIPEGLRKSVAAVLDAINMESAYTVDPTTGSVRKSGGGSPTRRTEAFQALRQEYQKILSREDSDMVVDPSLFGDSAADIVGNFDKIQAMRDVRLADMNTEQLTTIWNTIRAVERSITTAGKVLSRAKYAATSEWAGALERDTATRRPIRTLTDNGVLKSLMNPYTFFSQYGEAGLAIYRMLRNAQDQQEVMTDQVREAARKVVDPKTVKRLEETVGTFTTERGERLSLSKAQVMEIYLLMKRKQAQEHLLEGGIFQPAIKSAKIRRGEFAIRLTEKDLADIIGSLSDEEARIADGLQAITGGVLAEMGNRASMLAYGYQTFTEDHYWPIHSAKEGLYSEAERSPNNVRSIKNIGMAQQTKPRANNALDIPGVFDTFASHAGDMVDYAAWLAPMEDANRLFNFRYQADENAPTRKTVKGLLDRVGGAGSQAYWSRLMDDIQNGISPPSDDALTSRVSRGIGSFKSAAVGGNLRVVIQQLTAYPKAGITLSPADLSKGLARGATRGNGWEKALKYSPIAMRKADGGFDISSPMRMKEQMFDGRSWVQKLNDLAATPAGKADAAIWGRLWNACEWAVSREHKGLIKGSEAFYQKVNELFTEVIDQTQVVDGVLQRANIMRSRSEIAKQATSFMGEPIMALNLMIRAYDQVRYEQDPKKRGKAIKAFGRTVSALVLTNLVNAAAQSLVDALRDDDADKEYWERFLAAFTGITGEEDSAWDKAWAAVLGGNAGSGLNPLGQIPFVKDVFSLVQGYDVSRTDMEVFSDLVRAAQTMLQSADGGGSKTRAYAAREVAAAGAKVFGIPVGNLTRDAWALLRSVAIESGNIPLQYEMEKAIYNISSDRNYTRYIDILYRAKNSGDQAVYESIYADMVANGIPEKSIKSGMEQRMKKDQGVESVEDLSSRYLTPSQEQTYDRLYGQVSRSSVWRSASQAQRKAVEEDLYDLATGTDAGESLREKLDGGASYGVTDADYLLYLTAREIVDSRNDDPEKRNGSIDQAEAQEAIDMLSGLSDEARAYLWQSTNKGWSEEKNPYR